MDLMQRIAQKRQQMAQASGRREDVEKIPAGRSLWRILPSWKNPQDPNEDFWHDFALHYVHGVTPNLDEHGQPQYDGNGRPKTMRGVYVCERLTYGVDCPVCAAIAQARSQATSDAEISALDRSSAERTEYLVNAVRLDGSEPNKVVILKLVPSAFAAFLEYFEVYGALTDPNQGQAVYFTKEGTGMKTRYSAMPHPEKSAVNPELLTKLHDLDQYVSQNTEEKKKQILGHINAVAGILPAPASYAPPSESVSYATAPPVSPNAAAQPVTIEQPAAPAVQPAPPVAQTPPVQQVAPAPVAASPVEQPAVTSQPAVAPAAPLPTAESDVMSEAEMDELLAKL